MKKTALLLMSAMMLLLALAGCSNTTGTPAASELDLTPNANLSDKLFDFQIQIDGAVYTVPCPVGDLLDSGWTAREDLDFEMEPYTYTANSLAFQKNDITIYSSLVNPSQTETLPAGDCQLSGFTFTTSDAENGLAVVMPGGFSFGASPEDILALHGEPTEKNGDPVHLIEYEDEGAIYRGRWTLLFDTENNSGLKEIRITRDI